MSGLAWLVLPLINFVLFVVLLWAMLRRPVRVFLSTRRERFKRDIQQAESRRRAAEERLQKSEEHLQKVDAELVNFRRTMETQGRHESDFIIGAAEERAESMYLDAHRHVTSELARLKRNLYNQGVQEAMILAKRDIQQRIDEEGLKVVKRSIELLSKNLKSIQEAQ